MLHIEARAEILMAAIREFNASCINGGESRLKHANEAYEIVLHDLNIGCRSLYGEGSIALETLERCASQNGEVPLWGQIGEFVMNVEGMTTLVRYHPQFHRWNRVHFEFLALDKYKPFISPTGYKSLFMNNLKFGCSLHESAQKAFSGMMQGRLPLPAREYTPAWYDKPMLLQESSGQGAFNF